MTKPEETLAHPLVRDADQFATAAHAAIGQLYAGEPYCAHTRAVAGLLASHGCSPAVIAAGHLHDTIEDARVSRSELEHRFGAEVAQLVDDVSARDYPAGTTRASRVANEAARLAAVRSESKDIKCADISINMATVVHVGPRFARAYVPEKRALLASLVGARPSLLQAATDAVGAAEAALSLLSPRLKRPARP